jgi:hypothetical protein
MSSSQDCIYKTYKQLLELCKSSEFRETLFNVRMINFKDGTRINFQDGFPTSIEKYDHVIDVYSPIKYTITDSPVIPPIKLPPALLDSNLEYNLVIPNEF